MVQYKLYFIVQFRFYGMYHRREANKPLTFVEQTTANQISILPTVPSMSIRPILLIKLLNNATIILYNWVKLSKFWNNTNENMLKLLLFSILFWDFLAMLWLLSIQTMK